MRRVSRFHRSSLPQISANRLASTISVVRRPAFPSKPLVWQPIPLAEAGASKVRPPAPMTAAVPQQRGIATSAKPAVEVESAVGSEVSVVESVSQSQNHWLRLT